MKSREYFFGKNCLFINFNYTDTLHKSLGIQEEYEFHIHGEAKESESIIFGHNKHPQEPEEILYGLGGRFRGLYFIDRLLYETDKHCMDNIRMLIYFFCLHGVIKEEIKDIYVLGHSMSSFDMEYFLFLMKATKIFSKKKKKKVAKKEKYAVKKRYRQEREYLNSCFEKVILKKIRKRKSKKIIFLV